MIGASGSVLLWISAAAVAVLTVFLVRLMRQLARTATEVERLAQGINNDLLPRMERVLDRVEAELVEAHAVTVTARRISERADRISASVGEIVARTHDTVMPVLNGAAGFVGSFSQGTAVFSIMKAVWAGWRRLRGHKNDAEELTPTERKEDDEQEYR